MMKRLNHDWKDCRMTMILKIKAITATGDPAHQDIHTMAINQGNQANQENQG